MKIGSLKFTNTLEEGIPMKPSYFLNEGKYKITKVINRGIKWEPLHKVVENVFSCPIFTRKYVENKDMGYQYITASDMMKAHPLDGCKSISKRLTKNPESMMLTQGHILVSCAGTIGNTRLITSDLEGVIGSQDIIRVIPGKAYPYGFIYAYLASPTVNQYIQSMIYGSVVPRLEPYKFSNLPVILPNEKEVMRIHRLVEDAARLRMEGLKKLSLVHTLFDEALNRNYQEQKIMTVKSGDLSKYQNRLDASYNIGINDIRNISFNPKLNSKKIENFYENCFIPNRGKRNYTKKGIPYLSTTDMSTLNPSMPEKFISAKASGSNDVLVEKDWILIARSGQDILGSVTIVGDAIADYAVNEHAIRLVICKEKMHPNYVYGFLSSPFGRKCLRTGIFGSAILTINEEYVRSLEVPILENSKLERVINLVEEFRTNYDQAIKLENQAIYIIESAISS